MAPRYAIPVARPTDLQLLAAVERNAARLLVGHAPETVLAETTSLENLQYAQRQGLLWVALANDLPVGFAHALVLEPGAIHLEQVDVDPVHGRRGLGRGLVETVCASATAAGYRCVTLTTFRDVPWNMPFYVRLGFEVIPPDELSPALQAVLDDEIHRGLDPARRVAMRRCTDS